ncbi:MAG: hypothetical protein IJR72_00755 [Oscillospiraceae bacterium]|nr:hypothetical protein [Oscillospiraceae bacterium]
MRIFKRLFCVLLTLAALCGMTAFPVGAADSGYQLTVTNIQRFTAGTTFDPDSAPEISAVSPGDMFVLTVAFQNKTAAAVDVSGFAAKLYYDPAKVTPYTGTSPFTRNPYQNNSALSSDYEWTMTGNGKKSGFISVSGGGANPYKVNAGETLVLARMAFQASADASGEAVFTFDSNKVRTNITGTGGKTLTLAAFQPVRVTLGTYEITAVSGNRVTLSNPAPVTLAVSYFDAKGQFVSASTHSVPANAGNVLLTFDNAHKAYFMLFDDSFRPLCERFLYVMK